MYCSRRSFLGGMACLGVAGCVAPGSLSKGKPNLKFGVLSDIHITDWASTDVFRKTLRYFRDQDVDAVMIAGDLADHGILPQLENVAKAWFEVFPDNRGLAGKKVEKLFVYGNHDPEGLKYRDPAMDKAFKEMHLTYEEAEKLTLPALGLAKCWEKCFHEPYATIYTKNVKGYDFIGSHWDAVTYDWQGSKIIEDWWKDNIAKINTDQPFFYFQHSTPGGTIYGNDSWGDDAGQSTRCLAPYANAVAFSGHSHRPLTDGRSYWRGEFTSIGTSTLSYVCLPSGREGRPNYRENLDCRHGQIVSVYEDLLVIERRDFINDESLGDDVVLEMPTKASTFGVRAVAKSNIPAFAKEAGVKVLKDKTALELTFPGAFANPTARPFQYKVSVDCVLSDGKKRAVDTLWYQADACLSRGRAEKKSNFASVPLAKLPKDVVQAKVRITPFNSYGGSGAAIESDFIAFPKAVKEEKKA